MVRSIGFKDSLQERCVFEWLQLVRLNICVFNVVKFYADHDICDRHGNAIPVYRYVISPKSAWYLQILESRVAPVRGRSRRLLRHRWVGVSQF